MRRKLEEVEAKAREPIAIVGLACKFPGAEGIAAFWDLLERGGDAITEVPAERWDIEALYDPDPDAPGKMSTRWGGFVADADRFDAEFFGISPREALGTDPQQRILLETAWHALEDAAIPPDGLATSRTGVYVGLSTADYAQVLANRAEGVDWIDSHASLGNSAAVAAGRLSYSLGLQGPSMVVDTACSSSLVAVHLAVQALRSGEIGLGLAAGVNLVLRPELTIGFSKARMMAADGRCKTLDASADGYVRGEGCGVVVLKRLSDAIADGDRIHALVRGSAINQDGASNGLTAPNGPAQVAVIRTALENGGVAAEDVSYIEMHGTGTSLGDPIEARALGRVFGPGQAQPHIGSVKTNIGHLEAAAGMAGLIKVALSMGKGRIPAHLHFTKLNPHIEADGFPFRVPTQTIAWPGKPARRIAGVSSFGFSGTNGHIVLQGHDAGDVSKEDTRRSHILTLSARDADSLELLKSRVADRLGQPNADGPGLAATLASGRSHHPHRIAVVGETPSELVEALSRSSGARVTEAPILGFLFTGQGAQYPGMARGLMVEPVFRSVIARCDAALDGRLGRSLAEIIEDPDTPLGGTDRVQPLLFAIEVGLAELWRSWGITPAALLGHSVGEVAAACVAGAVSVEDGICFIAERGRLMELTSGQGGMAAIFASAEEVGAAIDGTGAMIAALNGPASTVIAGASSALEEAVAKLTAAGLSSQRLDVSTAFHSPVLDPVLDGIEAAAAAVAWQPNRLPVASNLTGAVIERFDADYWRRQARGAVRFADGLRTLHARGCTTFIEIGPHPVLSALGRSVDADRVHLPSLRRGSDDQRMMAEALARLYTLGAPVDWRGYSGRGVESRSRMPVDAPLYPFRRDRYWPEGGVRRAAPSVSSLGAPGHPLLGHSVDTPLADALFQARLDGEHQPFLSDHVVFGDVVAPGAMHIVSGLCLAENDGATIPAVADMVFAHAMTVPETGLGMQCVLDGQGGISIHGRIDDGDWVEHASGRIEHEGAGRPAALDIDGLRTRLAPDAAGPAALFEMLAGMGIVLGPCFQGLNALWRGDGEALAEIVVPDEIAAAAQNLPIHPASLDSCFQLLGATFVGDGPSGGFLPLSIDRVTLWQRPGRTFLCHARIEDSGPSTDVAVGRFTLTDPSGQILMEVEGLQIKRVAARDPVAESFLSVEWVPTPVSPHDWAEPSFLAETARGEAERLIAETPESDLGEALESLAAAFAKDALTQLGARTPDQNSETLGVKPAHARLFKRLFTLAAQAPTDIGGAELAADLSTRYPENGLEVDMVARCGAGLIPVMRGETDPLQLLFGDGGDGIYGGGGLAERINRVAAVALAAAVPRRLGAGPLRVVEIGAGTGATTEALLPILGPLDYRFTDISPAFLSAARQKFADRAGMSFDLLDLEQAPEGQGFPEGSVDVVVAANVVHATADIRQALAHARKMLAPNGLLVLVESTVPQLWWDIVFGLTEGWWRFRDTDLRPDHPLLSAARWGDVLRESGFETVETIAGDAVGRQSVILARRGADIEARTLLAVHDDRPGPARDLAHDLAGRWGDKAQVLSASEAVEAIAAAPVSVVYTGGIGMDGTRALKDGFELARAMVRADRQGMWLVTRGAQTDAATLDGVAGSGLIGLGKVIALEHPEIGCRRIDLDPSSDDMAETVLREVLIADEEDEIAWRSEERRAARLTPTPLPPVQPDAIRPITAEGCYLITGGFGGLGVVLADWLLDQGAGAVVLTGRHTPTEALQARLETFGDRVRPLRLDVSDESQLKAVLDDIQAGPLPLKGVFHLAGRVSDGSLLTQSWEDFAQVLPAKVEGARLLHETTAGLDLDCFVLFSTSASLIGNLGQANHAAANATLDALARARRANGLAGLSINWGAWGEVGAIVDGAYAEGMESRGVRQISPEDGMDALGRAMRSGQPQLGFVDVDWARFLEGYGENVPPFLARLRPAKPAASSGSKKRSSGPSKSNAVSGPDLATRLAEVPGPERKPLLATLLLEAAAEVLGVSDPGRMDPNQALNEVGLDSLLALELRNRLAALTGKSQPATLMFNYPSVAALTEHFAAELLEPSKAAPTPRKGATPEISEEDISAMSDAELEAMFDDELAKLDAG
jgi:acyl transferase domain-containing protein